MGLLFEDPLHDEFGMWALGFAPYGGADVGEVAAIAREVSGSGDEGDDGVFFDAWSAAAERLAREGENARSKGHLHSARESLLRAACFHAIAYHPLYGSPVDKRLREGFRRQMTAFDGAAKLFAPPLERLAIELDGARMPAYLVRASGAGSEARPLLIGTNGYDASVTELFLAVGPAAADRGYHCLLFDGPGQGGVLYEQGVPIRPDWEKVVGTVLDRALELDGVDADRVALYGWSLGGYLALRAASGEHRLAACVADPGSSGIYEGIKRMASAAGMSADQVAKLPEIPDDVAKRIMAVVEKNRPVRWRIVNRGFWVHGVDSLPAYARAAAEFDLGDRAKEIRCPTLLTMAENDVLASSAPEILDALTCPKGLIRFSAAEGAGEHCEILNRSLLNRRVFDWLDDTLG